MCRKGSHGPLLQPQDLQKSSERSRHTRHTADGFYHPQPFAPARSSACFGLKLPSCAQPALPFFQAVLLYNMAHASLRIGLLPNLNSSQLLEPKPAKSFCERSRLHLNLNSQSTAAAVRGQPADSLSRQDLKGLKTSAAGKAWALEIRSPLGLELLSWIQRLVADYARFLQALYGPGCGPGCARRAVFCAHAIWGQSLSRT